MPPKGKKKATARRQEPPRQPECRQEPPRQPERHQETADRFTLVLPPELSNLPPRQALASQSETTLPLRQAPASQSGTNTQSLQPRQAPASQLGTTTQSLQPRQASTSQSEATFQPPLSRQAPATLLSSQETIETVASRLQSQQSAHLEVISSQESITSRV